MQVELDDRLRVDAGLESIDPRHDKRHADAALEGGALRTAQGRVAGTIDRSPPHGGAAIVADEAHERVPVQAGVAEFCAHPANCLVHGEHHRVVLAALRVFDVRKFCEALVGGLHRGVHGVESQVKEPRLDLVSLDESDRLAAEGVGGVIEFRHLGGAAQNTGGFDITVSPPEKAEKFIEAPALRLHLRQFAQMPLAHRSGDVARGLEPIGQSRFAQGQALLPAVGIELMAEALLIAARQQARPARRTIRPRHIAVREAYTRSCQRIEVGRGDILAALEAHVRVAHIVADNEQDIGLGRSRGGGKGRQRGDKCNEQHAGW